MDTSFQRRHVGPRGKQLIDNRDARSKSLSKRKKTLFAKAKQLNTTTNAEVFLEVKPPTQNPVFYKTSYYKNHTLVKHMEQSEEEDHSKDVPSTSNDASASAATTCTAYPSPSKRRAAVKALYQDKKNKTPKKVVNKLVQTRCIDDVDGEIGPEVCRVCGVLHESEEDIQSDSQWLGCEFKSVDSKGSESSCGYWVHEKCLGFFPQESEQKCKGKRGRTSQACKGRRKNVNGSASMLNRVWYCPDHRLK